MLADSVDLGNGRAGVHQHPVGGDQIFQRNFIVDRLFRDRRPSATEHEDHQRRRILGAQRFQHGLGGTDRFLVGHRMASAKVAEAPNLRNRIDRTGHNALEAIARLHFERIDHGMRRFADGNHQHAIVGIKVMQVFANAEHSAIAIHVALKCPVDAGFRERMLEQMTRGNPHVQGKLLAIGGR